MTDLFHSLPVHLIEENIWECLTVPSRSGLRLTSKQLTSLTDQFLTSATFCLHCQGVEYCSQHQLSDDVDAAELTTDVAAARSESAGRNAAQSEDEAAEIAGDGGDGGSSAAESEDRATGDGGSSAADGDEAAESDGEGSGSSAAESGDEGQAAGFGDDAAAGDGAAEEQAGWYNDDHGSRASDRVSWLATGEHQAAFLARLPRLSSLRLRHWSFETDLIHALLQSGAAAQGRLRTLELDGEFLSIASTCAVRLAFPLLQELLLTGYMQTPLHGGLFLPLHGSALTHLSFDSWTWLPCESLRSVCGLSHLRRLELPRITASPANLAALATLRSLDHLSIATEEYSCRIAAYTPLFTLTRLTHLHLFSVGRPFELNSSHVPPAAQEAAIPSLAA